MPRPTPPAWPIDGLLLLALGLLLAGFAFACRRAPSGTLSVPSDALDDAEMSPLDPAKRQGPRSGS